MPNKQIFETLKSGIDAAQEVLDNWSSGDLAAAVNGLEHWQQEAQALLKERVTRG